MMTHPNSTANPVPTLPPLPGIDAATAVDRMSGNTRLYLKALGMFLNLGDQHGQAMLQALEARDWRALHRAVHTLKGLAGTIGADALHDEALALEQRLTNRENTWLQSYGEIARQVHELNASLAGVCRIIDASGVSA
jgi:HPt (histidine-containing phosphotransfer) domain-containing protein